MNRSRPIGKHDTIPNLSTMRVGSASSSVASTTTHRAPTSLNNRALSSTPLSKSVYNSTGSRIRSTPTTAVAAQTIGSLGRASQRNSTDVSTTRRFLSTTTDNNTDSTVGTAEDKSLNDSQAKKQSFDPNALEELLKSFEQMQKDPNAKFNMDQFKTPGAEGGASGFDPSSLFSQSSSNNDGDMSHLKHAGDNTIDIPEAQTVDASHESPKETLKGELKKHTFQTETRQMLDIVTNSLYTDKEVFLRELVSNASDALEKARYLASKNELDNPDIPLEVRIFADPTNKTITIQDTGIGMTGDELVSNLGTIARSGSKQWVKDIKDGNRENIIGQFGVGFYSGFMVGDKIEVYSRSGKKTSNDNRGHYWVSDGTGSYELAEADGVERGTKIVIHLRDNSEHFGSRNSLESILKKYSNFVGYPIYLDGGRVNTVQAIWNMSRNEVTEEQYAEFYRYIANAYDTPTYRMHFNADLPIQINALFYFPERHTEKYGMGRMDPGTSLYSRKVLIKPKAQGLLPDYLRFVQGVVDSEDIPLNISRENMQDSLLISRISSVLTKRIIKHLQDEAKKDPVKYVKWYNEFGTFIREGICSDFTHKNELARLLRFDSSSPEVTPDRPTSLDDYISRMPPEQDTIYYLCAPNRKSALASPYYESLKSSGYEVMFLYHPLDDFAMQNLREFNKRSLKSAESASSNSDEARQKQLEEKYGDLIQFIKDTLNEKVSTVVLTDKVTSHPAFIVDHESATMRKMIKMMDSQSMFGESELPLAKQKLQVNPTHPIFTKLMMIRDKQPTVAKTVVEQVFDNALMAADLLDNPRDMLPRMHKLMEMALDPTIVKEFSKDEEKM